MKTKILVILISILILFTSCDTTEPEFNPDKIFVEVENGTSNSDGEFEISNYSSETIFIHHVQFPSCSFFIYTLEQLTDTGWIKLSYNSSEGKWINKTFNPDSVYTFCEIYMSPIELKSFQSFEQKITGIDRAGEYHLTIHYKLSREPKASYNKLMLNYKVGY